jgi:hypothetical protein
MEPPREGKVEVGSVDEKGAVHALAERGLHHLADQPARQPDLPEGFDEAHDREVALVREETHAPPGAPIAAEAEGGQPGDARLQGLEQGRGVLVSGDFARRDEELERSLHGRERERSHARASPPTKRATRQGEEAPDGPRLLPPEEREERCQQRGVEEHQEGVVTEEAHGVRPRPRSAASRRRRRDMIPAVSRNAEPASFVGVRDPRPAPRAHAVPPSTPVAAVAAVPSHEWLPPPAAAGAMEKQPEQERHADDEAERKAPPRTPDGRLSQPGQKEREEKNDGQGRPGAAPRQAVPSALRAAARAKPSASRPRVTARSSGSVRAPPMTVRKLVSPSQRGTT